MATELDEDNIINALSGKPIIKACKNCKYYYKEWGSEANCLRDLKLDYHPVTGKKSWLGDTYRCNQERRIEDSTLYRSSDPCNAEGKWFVQKEEVKWFSSWFPKGSLKGGDLGRK
jgi:hypothetical protein